MTTFRRMIYSNYWFKKRLKSTLYTLLPEGAIVEVRLGEAIARPNPGRLGAAPGGTGFRVGDAVARGRIGAAAAELTCTLP